MWADGPWMRELADKIHWVDEGTGLHCIMRRNDWGAWCGYVAIDADHPMHGIRTEFDPRAESLVVHGGVTYVEPCDERADDESAICHDADDDRPAR